MIPANDSRSPNRIRLEAAAATLKERGAVDIVLNFDRSTAAGKSLEDLTGEAATVLEAIVDGKFSPAAPFGDSRRLEVIQGGAHRD